MEWITGMQKALAYIEANLSNELDYEKIASEAFMSPFHFQRTFNILCGYTLGEYIRSRRLTLAGHELISTKIKVIDLALKYGYDSPDSFTKAFYRFHGITPSAARKDGTTLKSFSPLSIKLSLEGGSVMDYKIEKRAQFELIGFKRRHSGGIDERFEQEKDFWINTRETQDELVKMRDSAENIWYEVSCNFDDDGYDHYICVKGDNPEIPADFEKLHIPEQLYVIVKTAETRFPTRLFPELRKMTVGEWLPSSGYCLRQGFEISVLHWYSGTDKKFIELWMPIEKLE